MDFILLDIKNFLKKLENGQLEIEAGQWELHKDLTNMKFAMGELKTLKEDVEKMRLSTIQQMNLIKDVQEKIELFKQERQESRPVTVSERSLKFEKVYKRPPDRQSSSKDYKKRKNHIIRSEEILEITSQLSNEKSDSEQEDSPSKTIECRPKAKFERNIERKSNQLLPRKSSHTSSQSRSNSHYSLLSSHDILQRYLKDSAKFMDRKKSKATNLDRMSSKQNSSKNSSKPLSNSECTPFWDEYGSRDAQKSVYGKHKENSSEKSEEKALVPKRFVRSNHSRKFAKKTDFLRHERNHRRAEEVFYCKICGKGFYNKGRLREHKAVHQSHSADSVGFKCCYCDQICSTPEKLTSHLRECRTIIRHHFKRK